MPTKIGAALRAGSVAQMLALKSVKENVMTPISRRAKAPHRNGTEVLIVEYQGKTMRATVTGNTSGAGYDDAPTPPGCEVQINIIADRSVVSKEIREMLDEAKTGNNMLLICRTFNIKKGVLSALGFAGDVITA